jgi:hypothetical protein
LFRTDQLAVIGKGNVAIQGIGSLHVTKGQMVFVAMLNGPARSHAPPKQY